MGTVVSRRNKIKNHRTTGPPDHRTTGPPDHRTTRSPDHGSVQNKSNKLNKLIGVIDCSSTWLSQDLPYAKAKIRENTKYWKGHTTLWKCQWHNEVSTITYRLLGLLFKTDSYRASLLVHMLYSHEIYKLSGFLEKPDQGSRIKDQFKINKINLIN